jgi:hypothetical protein
MTAPTTLSVLSPGIANAGYVGAGRVEKCAGSGDLNGEYRDKPEPRERRMAGPDRRGLCRDGTQKTAPLWHGPRLRAPFVAQVIGQVLAHNETAPPAAGYGANSVPLARILDRTA